jgi:hypothetical protein
MNVDVLQKSCGSRRNFFRSALVMRSLKEKKAVIVACPPSLPMTRLGWKTSVDTLLTCATLTSENKLENPWTNGPAKATTAGGRSYMSERVNRGCNEAD